MKLNEKLHFMEKYIGNYLREKGFELDLIEPEVLLYLRQYEPTKWYEKELNKKLDEVIDLYRQRCQGPIKLRVQEVLDTVEIGEYDSRKSGKPIFLKSVSKIK